METMMIINELVSCVSKDGKDSMSFTMRKKRLEVDADNVTVTKK